MQMFSSFFRNANVFAKIMTPALIADHKVLDISFVEALKAHPQQFVAFMDKPESNFLSSLETITLLNHVLTHSSDFYELINRLNLHLSTDDYWLNQSILIPYQNFIRKILHSTDIYEKIKTINYGWNKQTFETQFQSQQKMRSHPQEYFNFEMMCYCINLLNEQFLFLNYVPHLGRYYKKQMLNQLSSFVYINSYHITMLYFALKFIMNEYLTNHKKYLKTNQERAIFKDLLINHLQKINDHVKNILLNKYFNPIDKGIITSIFDLDRQNQENTLALEDFGIVCRKTIRNDFKVLKKKVFQDGKVNKSVFEESMMVMMKIQADQDNEDKENMDSILNQSFLNEVNRKSPKKQSKIVQAYQKRNRILQISNY